MVIRQIFNYAAAVSFTLALVVFVVTSIVLAATRRKGRVE